MTESWLRPLLALIVLLLAPEGALADGMVTLRFDDGTAENGFRMGGGLGHAVLFEAPSDEWTLSAVAVFGKLEPNRTSEIFVLEIWDETLNAVTKVTDRADTYFGDEFGWALVDIPDVRVSGFFLVSIYEFGGVYVGTDIGPSTGRSFITARNPNRILAWDLEPYHQNETEWMIRAVGSSPAPEVVSLKVLSEAAGKERPATIEVDLKDGDGNLKRATLFIAEKRSREVVWSAEEEIEGAEAMARFSWPGTYYRVSGPDGRIYPVLTGEVAGVPEELRPLLSRSAPCLLLLNFGESRAASYAYFGEDGRLHALIDRAGNVHFASREVLNVTAPQADYMAFLTKNVTASRGETAVAFYRMEAPIDSSILSTGYHEPIVLTRSPLFNYRVVLEEVEAKAGDYFPIVMVEDGAYNAVWFPGAATVERL
ncbi:MAG: hypothetical protein METHAR1v1_1480001 [Methanothrix sp.]|jgi:hypothetical protein|nr:MAG: hypothetical protein METHAR1v1_1480001 [Methanothrix sp.]